MTAGGESREEPPAPRSRPSRPPVAKTGRYAAGPDGADRPPDRSGGSTRLGRMLRGLFAKIFAGEGRRHGRRDTDPGR